LIQLPIPTRNQDFDNPDFDTREFAHLLETLDAHLPISDAFEEADPQKNGHWWTSQKEHMTVWFSSQKTLGSGGFTRSAPNNSAHATYQRLQSAEALLWIAEALGADDSTLRKAAATALKENRRSRPRIIRQVIPWSVIAELAAAKLGS
jgi:hypothetical protein